MRTLNRNKQKMKYSMQTDSVPVYETDDEGNIKYMEIDGEMHPIYTGESHPGYTEPVDFRSNIASTLTEAYVKAFGVDDASDKAVIVTDKGAYPWVSGTRIWRKREVAYTGGHVDGDSADYEVVATNDESLNEDSYLLKKLVHEGRNG